MSYKYCCDDFGFALNSGTDNEGYGSLISGFGGVWDTGNDLAPIAYCPWCGVKLRKPPSDRTEVGQ